MDFRLDTPISARQIGEQFHLDIFGDSEKTVSCIGIPDKPENDGLFWSKTVKFLKQFQCGTVICSQKDFEEISTHPDVTYLVCKHVTPRLTFSKAVNHFWDNNRSADFENDVESYRKREDLQIGENVFIAKGVEIGSGTRIYHNVSIFPNTRIGSNCIVRANASIGTEGLGLEYDSASDLYYKFPQIGGVVLEDHVDIGPGSTIRRSALGDTKLLRGAKIGALCNIGHNCTVGRNCILTCNVIMAGSSKLGEDVYMGIGSTLRHGANIGSKATIGQGAVVVKDVPEGETWVGNPAKKLAKGNG